MNFSEIKFRNLEINGGDDPLPDGRNCHDVPTEELRRELERLGVPVSGLTKAQMIGRYSQVLEYIVKEGSWHSWTPNRVNMMQAAKALGERTA